MYNSLALSLFSTAHMTTEGIFDFLRGDRTIPVSTAEIEQEENLKDFRNETWTLYTLNPESKECPLDCLIIVVQENCILSSSLKL